MKKLKAWLIKPKVSSTEDPHEKLNSQQQEVVGKVQSKINDKAVASRTSLSVDYSKARISKDFSDQLKERFVNDILIERKIATALMRKIDSCQKIVLLQNNLIHQRNGQIRIMSQLAQVKNAKVFSAPDSPYNLEELVQSHEQTTNIDCNSIDNVAQRIQIFDMLKVNISILDAGYKKLKNVLNRQNETIEEQSPNIQRLTNEMTNIGVNQWVEGAGIANIGFTCFVSAIFQCLFHTPPLVRWLLLRHSHHVFACNENQCAENVICQMVKMLQTVRQDNCVKPRPFMQTFRKGVKEMAFDQNKTVTFPPYKQQDANEFLLALLSLIDNQLGYNSPISSIFQFRERNIVTCLCGQTSSTYNNEITLNIPIDENADLTSLIGEFFSAESIEMRCKKCKVSSNSKKITQINEPSSVLIVVLKRFTCNNDCGTLKNQCNVNIPTLLKVNSVEPTRENVYELMALIKHIGTTSTSGHYTALVRTPCNSWVEYDDAIVKPIVFNIEDINRSEPYILFYHLTTAATTIPTPNSSNSVLWQSNEQIIDVCDMDEQQQLSEQSLDCATCMQELLIDSEAELDVTPKVKNHDHNNVISEPTDTTSYYSHGLDVDDDDEQPSVFRRNSPTRVTPLNIKKHIQSRSNLPLPQDQIADVTPTVLRHKEPVRSITKSGSKIWTPRLFTKEQQNRVEEWLEQERNTNSYLKSGAYSRIQMLIIDEFGFSIKLSQLRNWNNRRFKTNRKPALNSQRVFLTDEHRQALQNIRMQNPQMTFKDIHKVFIDKFPETKVKYRTVVLNCATYMENRVKGYFEAAEDKLILEQFEVHGMSWCKFVVPGRSARNIRQRYMALVHRMQRNIEGKSMTSILLNAFDIAAEKEPIVTRRLWLQTTKELNKNLSEDMIDCVFNYVVQVLKRANRIVEQNLDDFVTTYQVTDNKATDIPRQTLRRPLSETEKSHINELIAQCKIESTKKNRLQWHGNKNIKLIATTTFTGPRILNIHKVGRSFEDDKTRREFTELLWGNECNGDDDIEAEAEEDDDIEAEAEEDDEGDSNDVVNISDERFGRDLHVFGVIRMEPSSTHTTESERVLLFFTGRENIYEYIQNQLKLIFSLRCCPSWLRAFVTYRSKINWSNIDFLVACDSFRAGMRLKLTTASLLKTPHFNVRKTAFVPIDTGRTKYLKMLTHKQLIIDEINLQHMLDDMKTCEE